MAESETKPKEINEEYIVVATSPMYAGQRTFKCVISCDQFSIMQYIQKLSFSDEVELWFFAVDSLNTNHKLWCDVTSSNKYIEMDKTKSLAQFEEEVENMIDKLKIKK